MDNFASKILKTRGINWSVVYTVFDLLLMLFCQFSMGGIC